MKKILAISTSPFPYGENITDGPGYRAWHLFQRIAQKNDVVILSLYESFHSNLKQEFEITEDNISIKCIQHSPRNISGQIEEENPDILYAPWSSTPFLSRVKRKIPTIIDYVGAGLLEDYAAKGYIPITSLQMKLKSFWLGDFFLTAGQRERYYLLGLMAASKRLTLKKNDPSDPLIHVIPMTPPQNPPIMKNNVFQKKPGEAILLVAGAFLPWYDYQTLFKALEILIRQGKNNFTAVFMGGNPRDPQFDNTIRKMGTTKELKEKLVFSGLVPFKQRANFYLNADLAINIPSISVEDELSVRTRVVDYIWASLPIVSPAKDEYSAAVIDNGAGFQYKAGNADSLAEIISSAINDPKKIEQCRKQMQSLLEGKFNIEQYLSPLEAFISNPYVDSTRKSTKGISSDTKIY
jgi:glycosyltransferase involved in cell wall biosynthesis